MVQDDPVDQKEQPEPTPLHEPIPEPEPKTEAEGAEEEAEWICPKFNDEYNLWVPLYYIHT